MNRKDFLRLVGLASASGLLSAYTRPLGFQSKGKVIVVGAGMAGIAAAKMLQEDGYEVVIIEGQNRLGGRIRSEEFEGTILDFGASWIHGSKGNPITELVNSYGIKTKDTDYENVQVWDAAGDQMPDKEKEKLFEETGWVFKQAAKHANRQSKDISMEDCINAVLKAEGKLTQREQNAMNWRTTTYEMNAGCDFSRMSTWYGSDKEFGGYDKLFPGGYKQLIEAMAKGLDVRLNTIATTIYYGEGKVKVETSEDTFEGDYCILTVPLGVLKHNKIGFEPPLPKQKQKAISDKLSMGLLNKVAFKFDKVFWPKTNHFLGHTSNTRGDFPIFLNWAYYTGEPFLLGFFVGDYARQIEKLSDEELMARGNEVFSKMFDNATPIQAVARSKWNDHPFAHGSYSYVPVGAGNDGSKILAEPVNNLLFAGEATNSDYPATVHGAYYSGIREAKRIINK